MWLQDWHLFLAHKRRYHTRASTLFLTMWTLCLLGAFGVVLASGIRQKLTLVYRLDERQKVSLAAQGAAQKAIMWLIQEKDTPLRALNESWSNDPARYKDINIGEGLGNICYTVRDGQGGSMVRYGMVDEERKININTVPLGVLKKLFQAALGCKEIEAQELAASIVDWRDEDSQLSIPLGSAEDQYYSALSHPYKAKNAPFEVQEELFLVKGMRPGLYEAALEYLTLYGDGRVNINTAPLPVLMAVGLSEGLAEKIVEFRRGADRVEATQDDNIFDDPLKIDLALKRAFPLNDREVLELAFAVVNYLTTESNTFSIISNAQLRNKKISGRLTCVVDHSGRLLRWEES